MLMTELITKKRDGGILNKEEIDFMIEGYTKGEIPDYQMSSMLMAMYFRGLDKEEMEQMPEISNRVIEGVKAWATIGADRAMNVVNARPKQK